jgi:hypothetical protein
MDLVVMLLVSAIKIWDREMERVNMVPKMELFSLGTGVCLPTGFKQIRAI